MAEDDTEQLDRQHDPIKLNPILSAANDSMLDGLGQLADYFGYNRVMGKMYGALLLSPAPMSLDDLMRHLDISKASVSMNMRTLENMGIAREVWVRGDRRKYYEAEPDFWKILTNVLGSRELREVNQALSILESSITDLHTAEPTMSQDDKELTHLYIERMKQVQGFFRFAKLVLVSIMEHDQAIDVDDIKRVGIE